MADEGVIRSYRDLRVWNEAMELAAECYRLTRSFPREETFGMAAQMRRAASSVPANIAEGYGRESAGNYVQFLKNAQGSLKELETHMLLAAKVGLVAESQVGSFAGSGRRCGQDASWLNSVGSKRGEAVMTRLPIAECRLPESELS